MPKKHGLPKNLYAQLARLSQRDDLTIFGGKRLLGLYRRDGQETYQPQIAIWLDRQSGAFLTSKVFNPQTQPDGGVAEALETLALALVQSPPIPLIIGNALLGSSEKSEGKKSREAAPFQPGLPARLVINDEALAQAAQDIFAPLHVSVEYQADIPAFEAAFQTLSQQLGASADATLPEPFAWQVPQALLAPLYTAAAGLWRREPWAYMPDHTPIIITLGERGPQPQTPTLYASILGGLGLAAGVAFYYSLESFEHFLQQGRERQANNPAIDQAIEMLRQAGVPVDQIPPDEVRLVLGQLLGGVAPAEGQDIWDITEEGLVCFFNPKDECDPTYLDWISEHGLKPPSREGVPTFVKTLPGQEPQEPTEAREVIAMTLAFEALNQFFSHFRATLEGPLTPNEPLIYKARVGGMVVEVRFTPSEDMQEIWFDGEAPPDFPPLNNE